MKSQLSLFRKSPSVFQNLIRKYHLSAQQLQDYKTKGYFAIPNFKSHKELQSLKERAEKIVEEFDPKEMTVFSSVNQVQATNEYFLTSGDKIRCFFEEGAIDEKGGLRVEKSKSINKLGHAMHEIDPVFRKFTDTKQIKEIIKQLGYQDPAIVQSMYIFKQPFIGGRVTPHQDNSFLITQPPSVVGLWIGVEDATKDNGCLWVIPGSHLWSKDPRSFYKRKLDNSGTYFEPTVSPLPMEGGEPLCVPAGTMVVIHGNLVHYSFENRSPHSRHAYTVHIVERSNTKYPDYNWLQRPGGFSAFPTFQT